eukprot:TRINITY_DN59165_c0_g1_i1.p1 TRINITY_DN59165_c0_g1~~TRINITY_DN59165_c0_g1_i1.p1  ORF type:complete len:375 (+),score=63.25 TRINITY_DN59165_c0_g1_i1:71-1195(+)
MRAALSIVLLAADAVWSSLALRVADGDASDHSTLEETHAAANDRAHIDDVLPLPSDEITPSPPETTSARRRGVSPAAADSRTGADLAFGGSAASSSGGFGNVSVFPERSLVDLGNASGLGGRSERGLGVGGFGESGASSTNASSTKATPLSGDIVSMLQQVAYQASNTAAKEVLRQQQQQHQQQTAAVALAPAPPPDIDVNLVQSMVTDALAMIRERTGGVAPASASDGFPSPPFGGPGPAGGFAAAPAVPYGSDVMPPPSLLQGSAMSQPMVPALPVVPPLSAYPPQPLLPSSPAFAPSLLQFGGGSGGLGSENAMAALNQPAISPLPYGPAAPGYGAPGFAPPLPGWGANSPGLPGYVPLAFQPGADYWRNR